MKSSGPGWTYLSNHAHTILLLWREPDLRVREIAARIGITERPVLRIIGELEHAGVIRRRREGRRNQYEIDGDTPLRHSLEQHVRLADLLELLKGPAERDQDGLPGTNFSPRSTSTSEA
ncbi:MAG: winged helix-turn-helix domain-containing protein [Verrucomicrobia bacterium]|nr:MAG: winged helix-turn-helix domain-containing protein [Verrucomicrobiota bacterium]TAE87149.1 MAG: winged helix-turn-helix domain-containing protein [Verrucomicrobiota bacterium]TAF24953.1 MAG: winged helix-turn-helix domain-containing protein [Verrucomicrobiota bacterium]TAF40720.1 MAG: winged helix-turn-helix domain-containing protein [Verrucomicrobiota bacterium]